MALNLKRLGIKETLCSIRKMSLNQKQAAGETGFKARAKQFESPAWLAFKLFEALEGVRPP
jgi:hypothetical protein